MDILKNVGVAISTTERRKAHWDKLCVNYDENTPDGALLELNIDREYKGVAYSKNESLRKLYDAGCEYFYLFDDDVWLKRTGFFHWVYRVHKASGINHFCYMNPNNHKVVESYKFGNHTVNKHEGLSGCFLFLTRDVLDKVGGYDLDFEGYGYNHIEYTSRINVAYGRPHNHYLSINDMHLFLHSLDFDGALKGVRRVGKVPEKVKQEGIKKNNPLYKSKLNNLNRYCEF